MNKKIITGSAGFIGSSLCLKLLIQGDIVIGIDNHNDYYDPKIKEARIERLKKYSNYKHYKIDISNQKSLEDVFKEHRPQVVVNLAAQAGVRYSMENPLAYIQMPHQREPAGAEYGDCQCGVCAGCGAVDT